MRNKSVRSESVADHAMEIDDKSPFAVKAFEAKTIMKAGRLTGSSGGGMPHLGSVPRSVAGLVHDLNVPALILLCLLCRFCSPLALAATITGFDPSVWPRSDASLGIDGFVMEDFEDTALQPGLMVQIVSPSLGGYGATSILPFLYDASQDYFGLGGGVFNAQLMWDGSHGLINRPFLPITNYVNDGGWSESSA